MTYMQKSSADIIVIVNFTQEVNRDFTADKPAL